MPANSRWDLIQGLKGYVTDKVSHPYKKNQNFFSSLNFRLYVLRVEVAGNCRRCAEI